jgi:YD repeat-containing protein
VFLKRCVLVFASGALHCVLSPGAAAQTGPGPGLPSSCYVLLTANDLGIDLGAPVPLGAVLVGPNNVPGLGLLEVFLLTLATCPPPAPCPTCNDPIVGRPISVATGNTYIDQKDIRIPGLAGGLNLVRRWNSTWPASQSAFQVGLFGSNWRSTFEEQVFVGSDNYLKYLRGDGSLWSFGFGSYGVYKLAAPQSATATLTTPSTSTPYFMVTFQNGEQRRFDGTSGMLTAIVDRNGNTTTVAYDSASRLATVTDPASRHLYFGYGSPSSHLVTSVSSDVGITLTYAYDGQNRLSQVTNPDQSTLSFTYNPQSLITAVTDSGGKTLESHTYDNSGRGLTSSRAAGVDAVTVTYPNQ